MAAAAAEVASHYDYTLDPKTVAWVSLLGTAGMIYGTRLMAIRARVWAERAERAERHAQEQPADMGNVEILHPAHPAQGEPG